MGSSFLSFNHFGCYPDKDPNLASSYFCMSDRRIKLPNFTLELRSELKRAGEQAIPVNARDFYKDIFQDDLQEKRKSIHDEYEKGSRRTGKTGQKCGKAAPLLESADGMTAAPEKTTKN